MKRLRPRPRVKINEEIGAGVGLSDGTDVWVTGRVTGREGDDYEDLEVELLRAEIDDPNNRVPLPLERLTDDQRSEVEWDIQGDGYQLLLNRVRDAADEYEARTEDAADAEREERALGLT
jgi:hypothetical protein